MLSYQLLIKLKMLKKKPQLSSYLKPQSKEVVISKNKNPTEHILVITELLCLWFREKLEKFIQIQLETTKASM